MRFSQIQIQTISKAFSKKFYIDNNLVIPKKESLTVPLRWNYDENVSKWELQKDLQENEEKGVQLHDCPPPREDTVATSPHDE